MTEEFNLSKLTRIPQSFHDIRRESCSHLGNTAERHWYLHGRRVYVCLPPRYII